MNDEAAEPRGPSTPGAGPAQGDPAPSAASVPFSRHELVRPRHGRYVAGVCGALARATNTDPVLWRVLLAVLGVLGGVGVLFYLVGWLAIPAEGDTASPIESLLGKGRSGMAPLSVVLLGAAAVLTFAFVVNSGMRASMLLAAMILGAVLFIKRGGAAAFPAPATGEPATAPPTTPAAPHAAPATTVPAAAPPADEPVTAPIPPRFTPPTEGYRPPFAPHGPYAGPPAPPPSPVAPVPPPPPKKPKPPRERSVLGRLTFFAVLMVMGLLAALDMAGVPVAVSAYFAAALATIALGLVVGAWFGRARGLIALALVTSFGLLVSTGAERWGANFQDSVYRPQSLAAVADRYEFTVGKATLDLRAVDFTGKDQTTAISMKLGQVRVLLPANVDTTVDLRLDGGRAYLFGEESDGADVRGRPVTDLGADGAGGGALRLELQMEAGNMEVIR